jgi:hypothetical protein
VRSSAQGGESHVVALGTVEDGATNCPSSAAGVGSTPLLSESPRTRPQTSCAAKDRESVPDAEPPSLPISAMFSGTDDRMPPA